MTLGGNKTGATDGVLVVGVGVFRFSMELLFAFVVIVVVVIILGIIVPTTRQIYCLTVVRFRNSAHAFPAAARFRPNNKTPEVA